MAHHRGAASPVIDRILASGLSSQQNKSGTQQSIPQVGEGGSGRGPSKTYERYVDNSAGASSNDYRTPKTPIISFDQFMESQINRDPKDPTGGPGERIFSRSVTSRMRTPTAPGDQASSTRCPPSCAQSAPNNSGKSSGASKRGQGAQRSRPQESEYQVNVGTHVAVTGGPAADFRGRSTKSTPTGLADKSATPGRFASQANARRQDGAQQLKDDTPKGALVPVKGRSRRHIDFDLPASSVSKKDGSASTSLIQRFDRAVTNELNSRQLTATSLGVSTLNETLGSPTRRPLVQPNLAVPLRSTVSGVEIEHILYGDQDMMFHDAVDKLAQAEEACMFAGAVKAAEEAAARAPPELAEEAAAAGARTYRAKLVKSVHEMLPPPVTGCKPIEVIGYIGITRPYNKAV